MKDFMPKIGEQVLIYGRLDLLATLTKIQDGLGLFELENGSNHVFKLPLDISWKIED